VKILRGNISSGCGIAGDNLAPVEHLIRERTGLHSLEKGTLNIILEAPYIVTPVATITAAEYNGTETIKLQRCVIRGLRAIIMRPDTHELPPTNGLQLELLSEHHLRSTLNLVDGDPIDVEVEGEERWWAAAR
jgi:CTP-dependent riboflavin kinase